MNRTIVTLAAVTLMLAVAGCGGRTETNRALDPANELPFGHLDKPVQDEQVGTQTAVGGWAMDDRGIAEVRVYIDNHLAGSVKLNTDRPDVSKAFPQYARGSTLHGWTLSISFDAPGPHTVLAQAMDSDGATRDVGTVALTSIDK